METPTWSSDGASLLSRSSDLISNIENDKEDKKIAEEGKYPLSTPQVELLIQKWKILT